MNGKSDLFSVRAHLEKGKTKNTKKNFQFDFFCLSFT